ncbi:hypothetical protein [Mycobacterium sp. 852002-51971_SCH5477799-a]|nr:hypothetical protein [Mycobacterium sp. 852002-51971_SCH5477799-a]
MSTRVDAARRDCAISVLGGPTTAAYAFAQIDNARARLLSD